MLTEFNTDYILVVI